MLEERIISVSSDPRTLGIPRLQSYFGMWAMHQPAFEAFAAQIQRMDLASHVEAGLKAIGNTTSVDGDLYQVTPDRVAIVSIAGPMSKGGSSLADAGSTIRARRALRMAAASPNIKAILLHIESPGGTVAGTKELAEDVRQIAETNPIPIHTYYEDIGASAAYWVGSQSNKSFANESALVGSIGTYMSVLDSSEYAKQNGFKVHVIRAGEMKGAGEPGTEVTDAQVSEWQTIVNKINVLFTNAVSGARNFTASHMETIADGRVHMAADAVALGLIDGVRTLDEVVAELASTKEPNPDGRTNAMSESTEKVKATLEDIESAFPDASSDWVLKELKGGATLDECRSDWQAHLEAQLAESRSETIEQEARAVEAEERFKALDAAGKEPAIVPGNKGVGCAASGDAPCGGYADVLVDFRAGVDKEAAQMLNRDPAMRPMEARRRAMALVRAQNPQMARMLDAGGGPVVD